MSSILKVLAALLVMLSLAGASVVPPGGYKMPHFIAMNETMTCLKDKHSTPFNQQVRGVNLGGWMVLEVRACLEWLDLSIGLSAQTNSPHNILFFCSHGSLPPSFISFWEKARAKLPWTLTPFVTFSVERRPIDNCAST